MSQYLSKSRLDLIHRSPYLYWWKYLSGQYEAPEDTPAQILGRALHCRILEPGEFGKRYATIPPNIDRRTKEGKQRFENFTASLDGHTLITFDQDQQIERMHRSLMSNDIAKMMLLGDGAAELQIDWEFNGQPMRGVVDKYYEPRGIIIDVKTTDDASPMAFARSVKKYRYNVQAALYMHGMESLGYSPQAFVFIAIEKSAPYQMAMYYISPTDIAKSVQDINSDIEIYQRCLELNSWPMYDNNITELIL